MREYAGSLVAFMLLKEDDPRASHSVCLVSANSSEEANKALLEVAHSRYPENEGWYDHRIALEELDSLLDILRQKDMDFDRHHIFVASQYATKKPGTKGAINENSVSAVSAVSEDSAIHLLYDNMCSRYPRDEGWWQTDVQLENLEALRKKVPTVV